MLFCILSIDICSIKSTPFWSRKISQKLSDWSSQFGLIKITRLQYLPSTLDQSTSWSGLYGLYKKFSLSLSSKDSQSICSCSMFSTNLPEWIIILTDYPLLKDWIFFNYFNNRAPDDCVQYFTGTSGAFTSFNYMANTPQVLQSLNYKICFRQEEGALRSFNVVVVGFNEFLE